MDDMTKAILEEIRIVRKETQDGFKSVYSRMDKMTTSTNVRIDRNETKIHKVDKRTEVNKIKLSLFVAIIAFAFSGFGTALASYYFNKSQAKKVETKIINISKKEFESE